jgi:hypothetical protein
MPTRVVLLWHVHGSWTEAFVAGRHEYVIPVNACRDSWGRGLAGRRWPHAREMPVDDLRHLDVDLVVLQRVEEIELVERWLGRRPGIEVAAVYVEHNAPRPYPVDSRHQLAGRADIPVVHVTDFNRLMWDNGSAPTYVVEHGVADRGYRYLGTERAAAVMINEPVRRGRTVGTDLLGTLSQYASISVWGIDSELLNEPPHRSQGVTGRGDLPAAQLVPELCSHRVYLHTARWTSLGLSLIESMMLGMPVVAVASTAAPLAVPAEAGVVSADVHELGDALAMFLADRAAATAYGKAAREYACARYNLSRFLADWDELIRSMTKPAN